MTNPVTAWFLPALVGLVALAAALILAHRWDVGTWPRRRAGSSGMVETSFKVVGFSLLLVAAFVWSGDVVTASSGGGGTTAASGSGEVSATAGEQIFWGPGKCSTCHAVGARGGKIRGPNLGASPAAATELERRPIGLRAESLAVLRGGGLGRRMTAAEYLVESLAEPSAYLSHGFKDEMPKPYLPPISLTADQITAVILYLQSLGGTPDPVAIQLPAAIAQAATTRAASESWRPYLPGDSARGAAIFFDLSRPGSCARCHRVGTRGTDSGPDLSAIGASRPPQSLVDATWGPAATHGAVKSEELARQTSVRELHDLLAFLESLRPFEAGAGDSARGRELFFDRNGRAQCVRCHRLGNQGGDAGPDITSVVEIRSSPFILDAILHPGKYIAVGYQTLQVQTTAGRTIEGVPVRQTIDSLVLATADGGHVAVPVRAIAQRRTLTTSLMPDTLAKQMSPRDVSDLMAFLETLR